MKVVLYSKKVAIELNTMFNTINQLMYTLKSFMLLKGIFFNTCVMAA